MTTTNIYDGYQFLVRMINRDYRIKVFGRIDGKKINTLVGVSGLIKLIGIDLANSLTERALRQGFYRDVVHCKLRRRLLISFYSK